MEDNKTKSISHATFGMGCFWCSEAIFIDLKGVESVKSGYMGGNIINPTYKEVCSGKTNHAEVIQIEYDENQIKFSQLLEIFWKMHDPTTLNRQGNDIGTQYRSVVFYHSNNQKVETELLKEKLEESAIWENKIVTEISPASIFYPAEDYHHNYYNQNKDEPYCRLVIQPKIDKFKKIFSEKLNSRNVD